MSGLWIIFEGVDGAGKTTLAREIKTALTDLLPGVTVANTRHPGATMLGSKIRNIIKKPEEYGVTIDPLSEQMLMFTDHVNFKNTMLIPALRRGDIVLADRCDLISGLVYGSATGLTKDQINALLFLACGPTAYRADLMYVLSPPIEVVRERLAERRLEAASRGETRPDKYDGNQELVEAAWRRYASLITSDPEQTATVNRLVAVDNIRYLTNVVDRETTRKVAQEIADQYRSRQ